MLGWVKKLFRPAAAVAEVEEATPVPATRKRAKPRPRRGTVKNSAEIAAQMRARRHALGLSLDRFLQLSGWETSAGLLAKRERGDIRFTRRVLRQWLAAMEEVEAKRVGTPEVAPPLSFPAGPQYRARRLAIGATMAAVGRQAGWPRGVTDNRLSRWERSLSKPHQDQLVEWESALSQLEAAHRVVPPSEEGLQ